MFPVCSVMFFPSGCRLERSSALNMGNRPFQPRAPGTNPKRPTMSMAQSQGMGQSLQGGCVMSWFIYQSFWVEENERRLG